MCELPTTAFLLGPPASPLTTPFRDPVCSISTGESSRAQVFPNSVKPPVWAYLADLHASAEAIRGRWTRESSAARGLPIKISVDRLFRPVGKYRCPRGKDHPRRVSRFSSSPISVTRRPPPSSSLVYPGPSRFSGFCVFFKSSTEDPLLPLSKSRTNSRGFSRDFRFLGSVWRRL